MTQSNSHHLVRSTNNKSTTTIISMACSTLLIALGAAAILGESNHISFTTTVNAQLIDVLDNPEGSIQLATTFDDPSLQNVTVRALLTDGQKILPLSQPIEANLGLGEIRPGAISSNLK